MSKSIHKWVALVLLLALPLQGLAAVLMPFHCLTDEHHGEVVGSALDHEQIATHGHHGMPASTAEHDGTPAGNEAGHFCCHHVYTGAPSVTVLTAPATPLVSIDQIPTILPPFFPEQLLRPPRA